jgi:hypothetical protein
MGDKPIFSSERILQKDYGCKRSVAKEKERSLVMSLKGLDTKVNQLVVNCQL